MASLYKTERLEQLKKMLDFEHKPAVDKIKYMDLKEFKEKKVIPYPTEIK